MTIYDYSFLLQKRFSKSNLAVFVVLISTCLFFFLQSKAYADELCGGPYSTLSIVNRPMHGDSVCVVPNKNVMVEYGYQYQTLVGGGHLNTYPAGQVRLGLPNRNELYVYLPPYIDSSVAPFAGTAATTVGWKYVLMTNDRFIATLDALYITPSGSANYGSQRSGGTVSIILGYELTSQLFITGLLGVSEQSEPAIYPNQHFFTVIPDVYINWYPIPRLSLFVEAYGQTRVSPSLGDGTIMNAGAIYLPMDNLTFDVEVGHRINGLLNGYESYVGCGMTFRIQ